MVMYLGQRFKGLGYEYSRESLVNDRLLFELRDHGFNTCPFIPLNEYLQFRGLALRCAILKQAGLEIDCMTSEQFIGASCASKQRAKIVVTRSEYDVEINETWVSEIENRFEISWHWFATNVTARRPFLLSLPLGLFDYTNWGEAQDIAGDSRILLNSRSPKIITRDPSILIAFHDPHHPDREKTRQICKQKRHIEIEVQRDIRGLQAYYKALGKSEFCACPRGNGIDTHRFYESLYMGCIPILLKKDSLPCHDDLPVLVLNDWDELLDMDLAAAAHEIRQGTYNLGKLTLSYWINEIDIIYSTICD